MRYHQNLRCAMLPDCIVILPCLQRRPFVEKAVDSLIKFPHFICMKQDTLVHLISQTVSMNYKTRESNGILFSL